METIFGIVAIMAAAVACYLILSFIVKILQLPGRIERIEESINQLKKEKK